jgi:hypothetical protein
MDYPKMNNAERLVEAAASMDPDQRVAFIMALMKDLGESRLLKVLAGLRHEITAIELAREFSKKVETD